MSSCKKSDAKKYTSRPGPPYPANKCIGMRKKGNDGGWYVSTYYNSSRKDGLESFRWVKAGSVKTVGAKVSVTANGKKVYPNKKPAPSFRLGSKVAAKKVTFRGLENKTVAELKSDAKKKGLTGYSKLNKAELVKLLRGKKSTKKTNDDLVVYGSIKIPPSKLEKGGLYVMHQKIDGILRKTKVRFLNYYPADKDYEFAEGNGRKPNFSIYRSGRKWVAGGGADAVTFYAR